MSHTIKLDEVPAIVAGYKVGFFYGTAVLNDDGDVESITLDTHDAKTVDVPQGTGLWMALIAGISSTCTDEIFEARQQGGYDMMREHGTHWGRP